MPNVLYKTTLIASDNVILQEEGAASVAFILSGAIALVIET